ncbi:hypothetical protein BJV77DRAFT_1069533 [Russula vinacea]|nr:hypothetical protein BJV77DRAFT_1069533 [Russula vinacea]
MSAVPDEEETASTRDNPLQNLLFDYAGGADIILCSQDGCQFRVPKTSIINNSPTLGELIQKALDPVGFAPEALLPVAESALSLVRDQEDPQAQINWTPSQPETFDVSDTNLIIRSSDHIDFRVHSPYWQQHANIQRSTIPSPAF